MVLEEFETQHLSKQLVNSETGPFWQETLLMDVSVPFRRARKQRVWNAAIVRGEFAKTHFPRSCLTVVCNRFAAPSLPSSVVESVGCLGGLHKNGHNVK